LAAALLLGTMAQNNIRPARVKWALEAAALEPPNGDECADVRGACVTMLARFESNIAHCYVQTALRKDTERSVRYAALEALGEQDRPDTVALLGAVLLGTDGPPKDPDEDIRAAAIDHLESWALRGDTAALAALERAAREEASRYLKDGAIRAVDHVRTQGRPELAAPTIRPLIKL
jgi:hypothetical protein